MADWRPIKTAPRDGTWIKVRGFDWGVANSRRHYAIAFFEAGRWQEVGSAAGLLNYLTDWQPLADERVSVLATADAKPLRRAE